MQTLGNHEGKGVNDPVESVALLKTRADGAKCDDALYCDMKPELALVGEAGRGGSSNSVISVGS